MSDVERFNTVIFADCQKGASYVRASDYDALAARLEAAVEALRLFQKYAPLSGDMALMIRANQGGGQEIADRANKLVEHYGYLDEAHDKARLILGE
jgi:hypothetical protein